MGVGQRRRHWQVVQVVLWRQARRRRRIAVHHLGDRDVGLVGSAVLMLLVLVAVFTVLSRITNLLQKILFLIATSKNCRISLESLGVLRHN